MSERNLRRKVIKCLNDAGMHAFAVENECLPGTPDVNYAEGWIELKALKDWPIRAATPVRIPHYTAQQRRFLERRWNAGGNAYLLIQIGRVYLLYDGVGASCVGSMNRAEMLATVRKGWSSLADMREELPGWLRR